MKTEKIRRSPYLIGEPKIGEKLKNLDVEFRRPGTGMSPKEFENTHNQY